MKPLYVRKKVVPYESLLDLVEDTEDKPFTQSIVYSSKRGERTNTDNRSTSVKWPDPKNWIDINASLLSMLSSFQEDPNQFEVLEYNLLEYQKFDKFVKHRDTLSGQTRLRKYSTSTIIKTSKDLVGGDLIISSDDGYNQKIDLDVGETVMFSSDTLHEVTEVQQGVRLVLVAWIYKKIS